MVADDADADDDKANGGSGGRRRRKGRARPRGRAGFPPSLFLCSCSRRGQRLGFESRCHRRRRRPLLRLGKAGGESLFPGGRGGGGRGRGKERKRRRRRQARETAVAADPARPPPCRAAAPGPRGSSCSFSFAAGPSVERCGEGLRGPLRAPSTLFARRLCFSLCSRRRRRRRRRLRGSSNGTRRCLLPRRRGPAPRLLPRLRLLGSPFFPQGFGERRQAAGGAGQRRRRRV